MKQSKMHIKTLKESPFEGQMPSQNLMFRAGMIKKNGAGEYILMPYGHMLYESLKSRIELVFDDLNYQKLNMPTYNELEILKYLRSDIVSYKDLPLRFVGDSVVSRADYSVKHGLIKPKHSLVKAINVVSDNKDAINENITELWNESKKLHVEFGIPFNKAELLSESGEVKINATYIESEYGDTTFYRCTGCEYCSDEVGCDFAISESMDDENTSSYTEIHTPDIKTIADLEKFMNIDAKQLMKTMLLECVIADKKVILAVVIRGDRALNINKVARYLNIKSECIQLVNDIEIVEMAGTVVGFAGPVGIKNVMLLVDREVSIGKPMVAGANKRDYHIKDVVYGRDFSTDYVGDFSTVVEGDLCPKCSAPLEKFIGYTLMTLKENGQKLSEDVDIKYRNDEMKDERPYIVNGYIDLYKMMVAYLDYHCEESGFVLTRGICPFDVHVIVPNIKKEEQIQLADEVVKNLKAKGLKVLLDDRKGGAGGKFKDSDLLGIPVRITTGKMASERIVELKYRDEEDKHEMLVDDVVSKI